MTRRICSTSTRISNRVCTRDAKQEKGNRYVGRWSRLVAREFLAWLAIPQGARWLDIGCGTGALSQTILDVASPREITGIDPSEGYITFARQQVRDSRVSFRLGDAQALPEASASYDAVVAGLVLNFVPQPSRAVRALE